MKYFIFYLALCFSFGQSFDWKQRYHNNKFIATLERIELVSFNPDLVRNIKVTNFKYNRTTTLVNGSMEIFREFKIIWVYIIVYKWDVNVYKRTAIEAAGNICRVLRINVLGTEQLKISGNVTNCPMKKGIYAATNIHIMNDELPPNLIEGSWKVRGNATADGVFAFAFDTYARIDYPVRKRS